MTCTDQWSLCVLFLLGLFFYVITHLSLKLQVITVTINPLHAHLTLTRRLYLGVCMSFCDSS